MGAPIILLRAEKGNFKLDEESFPPAELKMSEQ
jgi:hypothetical protein